MLIGLGTGVGTENTNLESSQENTEESSSQEIQQTNQQNQVHTDPRLTPEYLNLLEETIRSKNRENQELLNRVGQAQPVVAQPAPQLSEEELRTRFFENPDAATADVTRRVIREELGDTVSELRDFVRNIKGQTVTDQLIAKIKVQPQFATMWDDAVENAVRVEAAKVPPSNLNENTIGYLALSAIGMKATGMLPNSSPITQTQNQPVVQNERRNMPIPAHIRPSAPAAPSVKPKTDADIILTEDEERILREYNSTRAPDKKMSRADYKKLQDMPGREVVGGNK